MLLTCLQFNASFLIQSKILGPPYGITHLEDGSIAVENDRNQILLPPMQNMCKHLYHAIEEEEVKFPSEFNDTL